MTLRARFIAILTVTLPVTVFAQAPGNAIAPPIPTGPPLVAPVEVQPTTWVEGSNITLSEGAALPTQPGYVLSDAVWPGTPIRSGSACNFDQQDGSNGFLPNPASVSIMSGAYFSGRLGPTIPAFNYVLASLRQTWDLGSTMTINGPTPGSWEFVADLTGANIVTNYGNWFAGGAFFLRYNWTESGSFFMPYTQGGVGAVLNDAYKTPWQKAVGQEFEFYLHVEAGVKCFITPNLSLDFEGGLQHISNGGLARRNYGVNAFGGSVGLTYHFGG
ncbi:MAG TPA: acyloxyacyl hydrolase [Gemmataceae bacterium]|jgi:hypothetical protein|nr:acyloxyacyl hydrolase [Gemmataceae bacterium]